MKKLSRAEFDELFNEITLRFRRNPTTMVTDFLAERGLELHPKQRKELIGLVNVYKMAWKAGVTSRRERQK